MKVQHFVKFWVLGNEFHLMHRGGEDIDIFSGGVRLQCLSEKEKKQKTKKNHICRMENAPRIQGLAWFCKFCWNTLC